MLPTNFKNELNKAVNEPEDTKTNNMIEKNKPENTK